MTSSSRIFGVTAALVLAAGAAGAQTPSTAPPTAAPDTTTRPATTTFLGDTGLWFVPTAEVLAHGQWSASGYRRGTNYIQGYTNVADFAGTFAFGIKDRAEVFGSFLADTRIDRDTRPIFINDSSFGGIVDRYPLVNQGWTGDNVGDLYLGAKVNLWSESRGNPVALAVRGIVKLPTGKKDAGVSTGKADARFDFIASKEAARIVDLSGFGGFEVRGKPDGIDTSTSAFNWGAGAAFPSRSPLRVVTELNGVVTSSSTATITGASPVGVDGSLPPAISNTENLTRATAALTFQAPKGFFVGGGLSWNVPRQVRAAGLTAPDDNNPVGDYWDWQVRIGYHPGLRAHAAPAPAPPAPMPVQAAQPMTANRPPTVRALCDPCTVEVGKNSTVTANAQDPDGDPLTFRWSAPTGTLQNPANRQTLWTAPQQVGPVPVTVTVDDGKGGTASDMVTIQVISAPPVVQLNFEDIYFDFDRSTLRPEALRLLDDAVTRLQANPGKNIIIEGHTCNIGTAEYNLALGDRRANSVKSYLLSRGVAAGRLETRSYGEEQPKFDNAREETRRLNRRAALVVKIQ
jgi:outer membrane protein OmpA-like peptidoglycan-associated protein